MQARHSLEKATTSLLMNEGVLYIASEADIEATITDVMHTLRTILESFRA